MQTERDFWTQWTAVTLAGFLLSLLWVQVGERPHVGAVVGAIGGLSVGTAQWFVLRNYISHPWRWIGMTAIAWCLLGLSPLGAIGWMAPRTPAIFLRILYGLTEGIKVGIWLGLCQWIVLRNSVFRGWRWVLASPLCWGVGLPLGWVLGGILRELTGFFLGEVFGLMLTWAIVAGLTGVGLIQLFWIDVKIGD
ncbi:MAG: hypothetical protein ACP5D7_19825 [Limnospira sp.]